MRGGASLDDAIPVAAEIIADVRARGDAAVLDWTEKLDRERPAAVRVPAERIAAARVDDDVLAAVRELVRVVREFHALQLPEDISAEPYPGVRTERRHIPLGSVGVYVPGGRATLPSSLIMAAVPAQVAGVQRIAVCSPRPAEVVLAVARELGIDEVYAVGGAQAIGALAYGTESIAPVDKIVGPGNRWVTAAKLLVASRVGIDLPAGPSEVLIVADDTANPRWVAADLRAQAEHGPDSETILVTTSAALAAEVRRLLEAEDAQGAGAAAGAAGVAQQVQIEVVATLDEALARADDYAAEHLQLMVADPEAALARVRNAGAIFLGNEGSAVLGDYAAGTNHVLPTGGLARGSGGLGLEAFIKPVEIVRTNRAGLAAMRPVVAALARVEGLPLHGAAVEARFADEA